MDIIELLKPIKIKYISEKNNINYHTFRQRVISRKINNYQCKVLISDIEIIETELQNVLNELKIYKESLKNE